MRGSWSLPRRVTRLPGTRWRSGIVTAGRWPPRGVSPESEEALCQTRGTQRLGRAGSSRIEGREMGEGARGPTERNWQDSKGGPKARS